jgi:hypothetical protein
MFEQWIGPDVFRQGVNEYLRAHAWKNAVAGDLWESLGKVSGKDVPAAMAGYIDQQGLPLVGVELVPGGQAKFSQKRFLNYGVKADPLLWSIPVSFKWSDGSKVHTEQIFMIGESATFTPKGGKAAWVMPNVDGRGYYRWSAPQDMMLRLSREAVTAMNPAERIAFLGNAQALLQAGEIRAIRISGSSRPSPTIRSPGRGGGARRLGQRPGRLRSRRSARRIRSVRAQHAEPMAKRFGLEKKAGEAEVVSLMRPRLFAWLGDEGNDPAALSLATRIANDYMADPAKPDPSMVGTALQLTTMHGDRALFDRYRKAFEEAQDTLGAAAVSRGARRGPRSRAPGRGLRYVLEGPVRVNEMRYITAGIRQQSDRAHDKVFRLAARQLRDGDRQDSRGVPGLAAVLRQRLLAGAHRDRPGVLLGSQAQGAGHREGAGSGSGGGRRLRGPAPARRRGGGHVPPRSGGRGLENGEERLALAQAPAISRTALSAVSTSSGVFMRLGASRA